MDVNIYRYASYANFPREVEVFPTLLADAGFYYEGNGDEVVCYSCGVKYKGWKKGDNPIYVHRMLSPHCRFINEDGMNTKTNRSRKLVESENGNKMKSEDECKYINQSANTKIPAPSSELGAYGGLSDVSNGLNKLGCSTNCVAQTSVGEAVLSTAKHEQKPFVNNTQERNKQSDKKSHSVATKFFGKKNTDPLGISFERPVYPHYAITTVRLTSFREWPKQMKQKPQDLAKAGFFHEGDGDKVRCFFCGGGLVNWDPEDEPWTEHARWYPRCVFLRQTKGDDFIFKVQTGITEPDEKPKETEITDPLSNPAFMSLIDMGCKPDTVRRAYDVLSEVHGQENITAEKLLLEVWKLEEEFKGNHSSNKEKTAAHTSNYRQETETEKEIILKDSLKDLSSKQLNREERLCIEQENRRLKEQQTCKICLDEDVAIVFLPCGHMASCASCAPALRKCPICRTFIKGTVRAILS